MAKVTKGYNHSLCILRHHIQLLKIRVTMQQLKQLEDFNLNPVREPNPNRVLKSFKKPFFSWRHKVAVKKAEVGVDSVKNVQIF